VVVHAPTLLRSARALLECCSYETQEQEAVHGLPEVV